MIAQGFEMQVASATIPVFITWASICPNPACTTLRPAPSGINIPAGELLGCVIAHELGHLLLGTASHSQLGLMSAVWQDPELQQAVRGGLFFTAVEGERMRSRFAAAIARLRKLSDQQPSISGK